MKTLRFALAAGTAAAVVAGLIGFAGTASAATLLADDFNDGNATGWTTSGGSWSVSGGVYSQTGTSSDARAQAGQLGWTNYSVQVRVRANAFNGTDRFVAVLGRAQGMTSYYYLTLRSSNRVELKKLVGGSSTTLAAASRTVSVGTWYTVRLEMSGTALRGFIDGVQILSATDSQFTSGRAGVATFNASGSFDDVLVSDSAPAPPSSPPPTSASPSPSAPVSPSPSGSSSPPVNCANPPQIVGFASVNAMGFNGTTGGCGGPTVTVTTGAELADYAGRAGPYIIRVSGTISFDDMITVVANKTIIGVGSTAHITGGGLQLGSTTRPGNNVIIRNIRFSDPSDDSVSVTNSAHHVWIDHNEFSPGTDGSVDVKRQSTFVTVSWNWFRGTDKSMLLGHSDGFTADIGFLKVTYHHNFFDASNQRHPRVRFGDPVHVFNNYYRNIGLYGIASTENGGVLAEGNYFENVAFPCHSASGYADSAPGRLVERNNVFVNSGTCETGGTVADPRSFYSYTVDNPLTVPSTVPAGVGVGKIGA